MLLSGPHQHPLRLYHTIFVTTKGMDDGQVPNYIISGVVKAPKNRGSIIIQPDGQILTPCLVQNGTGNSGEMLPVGMAYSIDLRNAAVHLYTNHVRSLRRVVAMLGNRFSKSTLHRWLESHPITRCRLPTPRKLTGAVKELIEGVLVANPFATAQSLVQVVKQHLRVIIGRSTISRAIKQMGFSRKRTYARAPDTDRIVEARKAFCNAARDMDPNDFVSVDETCLYFHPRPRVGYAQRGRRLHVPLHQKRHNKFTLTLAVSTRGVVGWQLLQGSGTSGTFAAFINSLPCINQHVLLDNVSFHKSTVVKQALEAKGLAPMYTPPYSPEYNPVDMAFSVFKAHMRGESTGKGELPDMHTRVLSCARSLTPSKLAAMFRHVWELICRP